MATGNNNNSDPAGPIIGFILLGLFIVYVIVWYLFRLRFWYRTSKCISIYSCICGWICCWKHEIRRPPHTGFLAGNGRKSRAKHVALCFPHNPIYPCCPTGCSCDPCCDDSVESRNQRRRRWDPEAHPWGLGCAIPCCPLCCIQCLCEDELNENLGPSSRPDPHIQDSPAEAIGPQQIYTGPRNTQIKGVDAQSPAPPSYNEVVASDSNPRDALPPSADVDEKKQEEISPVDAAKVLAKFAARGMSNLASSIVQTARKGTAKQVSSPKEQHR